MTLPAAIASGPDAQTPETRIEKWRSYVIETARAIVANASRTLSALTNATFVADLNDATLWLRDHRLALVVLGFVLAAGWSWVFARPTALTFAGRAGIAPTTWATPAS